MTRVGLVLGAGGSVGHAFHAGVLTALADELRWDARCADVIVGTSAGSVAGALLRAGMSGSDLAARALDRPLSPEGQRLLARSGLRPPVLPAQPQAGAGARPASPARLARAFWQPWRITPGSMAAALLPAGQLSAEAMRAPMSVLFGDAWPDRPLWINAVDLDRGERVVFGREGAPPAHVAEAVAASCAIPAYFAPVEIGGARYVDGGVHSPTNADVMVDAGVDLVLVSSPMSTTRTVQRRGIDAAMRHALRLALAGEVARLRSRGIAVVSFAPDAADQEVMAGNPLDPAKRAPVCRQVMATTVRRLRRADVRARLAALL